MNLLVQRILTLAFINMLPTNVVFTPREKSKKPAGGFVWVEGVPRPPQTVTFIETSAQGGLPRPTVTLDGVERVAEMTLIGAWDATIARYDFFTHQNKDFEVIDLFYNNGYETRALVSGRG